MTKGRKTDNNTVVATIDVKHEDGFSGVNGAAELERAISETGYGLFNVLLLVAALPAAWSGIFDTTTTAFVLISAECDLGLTTVRKGVLAAIPFLGIILASLVWDRVTPYVATRNLLIVGLLADTALNVLGSALDSYYAFLTVKLLTGVLVGGPFSMVTSYLSEFHSSAHKAGFARWAGLIMNAGIIIPAALGYSIVPLPLDIDIFYRRYTAWRIYLLICSMVPLVGILTACALPYTPKQLLETGRHDEALNLLRRMYALNWRKPADSFPIRRLLLGSQKVQPSRDLFFEENSEKMRVAWYNAKLLCSRPYLRAFSQLGFLQFGSSLLFNTMRLWVPHTFMIISNFDASEWTKDRSPILADLLHRRYSVTLKQYYDCPNLYDICVTWNITSSVYLKSTIIAVSTVGFAFLAGLISGSDFRRKTVMLAGFLISTGSGLGMSWVPDPPNILTLAAAIIVTGKIASNAVAAVSVLVIPVPLRGTSVTIFTNLGNLGAILGNVYLSAIIDAEPAAAFVGLGVLSLVCFFLSLLLPGPVKASPKPVIGSDNA
ncbi:synaptic vesicle glycoprotein 2B isoform X2 [Lasioglossum baleicum]|uniref:synaptic vesicle glycoprotein 2B isoform X2 n=1 Tax=Lasioglossum baleicum TaxID=434251 RepID=UPI003FCD4BE3